jgi:hypothetical protein
MRVLSPSQRSVFFLFIQMHFFLFILKHFKKKNKKEQNKLSKLKLLLKLVIRQSWRKTLGPYLSYLLLSVSSSDVVLQWSKSLVCSKYFILVNIFLGLQIIFLKGFLVLNVKCLGGIIKVKLALGENVN